MKDRNRALERGKRKYSIIITVLVLVLAFVGCYQYYSDPQYTDVVQDRLLSSAIYSAIKLYTFSSTVSPGKSTPLCYEIAKWLAPFCTGYWLFQLAETLFRHQINTLRRVFSSKKQLVIFGYNEKSRIFIENLCDIEGPDRNITLVAPTPLSRDERLLLEREHVLVHQVDLLHGGAAFRQDISWLHLERTAEIILFDPEPTENMAMLIELIRAATENKKAALQSLPDGGIYCAIWCEDRVMQKIIVDYYDDLPGRKPYDIHLFSMPDIAADDLLLHHPLYQNCLSWAQAHAGAGAGLLRQIPMPHVLIVGFEAYGRAFFEKAILTGMLSERSEVPGYETMQVTIMDKNIAGCREILRNCYPGVHHVCKINFIEGDAGGIRAMQALAALPRVTYAVICLASQTSGINITERLQTYLETEVPGAPARQQLDIEIPIAVRMKNDDAVIRYCYQDGKAAVVSPQVTAFGTDGKLLTYSYLVQSQLEASAKEFNATYQRISSRLGGQPPAGTVQDMWNRLSFEKKDACRAQARNVRYFRALLGCFPPLPPREEVIADIEDTGVFLQKLAAQGFLEELSALEHRRWCAFCYAYGYAGLCASPADKGKEKWVVDDGEILLGKVHPCLIDEWDGLCGDPYGADTVVYDVCSIYAYADSDAVGPAPHEDTAL